MMRYNNNPANIRYNVLNRWLGLTGKDNGFCTFSDIVFGIRALCILLRTYISKYKCDDVTKIISRFAPPSENNTCAYIRYVSNYLSTRGYRSNNIMFGTKQFCCLICAIMFFESNTSCDPVRVENIINMFHLK